MRSALKGGQWQIAGALAHEAHELGYRVSPRTYDLLCLQIAIHASWQMALETFLCLRSRAPELASSPCASAVLGACALGSSFNFDAGLSVRCNYLFMPAHGSWAKMLCILQTLLRSAPFALAGHNATVALNIMLGACVKAHAWERALAMVPAMKTLSFLPSVATLGTVLAACERASQWKAAVMLLGKGGQGWEGVLPNVVCYNTAIAACRRARQWKHALCLLQDAHQQTLQPDSLSVAVTLRAVGSLKGHMLSGCGEQLLSDMRRDRVADTRLDILGHPEGITLLGYVSWTRALDTLQSWIATQSNHGAPGCTPAPATFINSALSVLRRNRLWAEALHLMTICSQKPEQVLDVVSLVEFVVILQDSLQTPQLHAFLLTMKKTWTDVDVTGAACCAWDLLLSLGFLRATQLVLEFRAGRPLLQSLQILQAPFSRSCLHDAPRLARSRAHVKLASAQDVSAVGLGLTRGLLERLRCNRSVTLLSHQSKAAGR